MRGKSSTDLLSTVCHEDAADKDEICGGIWASLREVVGSELLRHDRSKYFQILWHDRSIVVAVVWAPSY